MQRILFILLLHLSVAVHGQTPDYFANDPRWVVGFWNGSTPGPLEYDYHLQGDTTIDGKTYHHLYSGNISTGYYLRQEGKSIRFYFNQGGNGVDSLLISYDYQVGDTLRAHIDGCYAQQPIQKIDSILVNAEYRKVFYIDSINGPLITEGIGHQINLNLNVGGFITEICQGLGFDYYIFCYGQNNTAYWDPYGTSGTCNLHSGIETHDSGGLEIFPNPLDNYLNIRVSSNTISECLIYDLTGRIVLRKHFTSEIRLSTIFLDEGIYFYEVRSENRVIDKGKIIKNKN